MKNTYVTKETTFAGKKLVLEFGELAHQTNMTVKATYGDTVILTTVVAGKADPSLDFFPLKVEYEERLYASGLIKSSRFVKRDGRPTDEAVVSRRLIDHAIRPLFPEGFTNEVQVVNTVLSLDEDANSLLVAMIGTSAALHASDIPWNGPMVSAQVGYKDDYVLNPTKEWLEKESILEMIVSFVGEERRFLAVEAEIHDLPENVVLGAMEFAWKETEELYNFIVDFAKEVNPEGKKFEFVKFTPSEEFLAIVMKEAGDKIEEAVHSKLRKMALDEKINAITAELVEKLVSEDVSESDVSEAVSKILKKKIRKMILTEKQRPDGRAIDEVRPLSSKVGLLPRVHGSALFNRGLTQSLTIATLGSPSDELIVQDMYGERTKRYIHYYNFPPFSTGEVGRVGNPKPREIGHGMLAEKALRPVIPSQEEFPYTILVNSELLSSNGSTSMASTCASSLALMDAGVPIKAMVGGIATGLVADVEKDEYLVLTDIAGIEDHAGYMDFKMTGTRNGVTAIQVDMKLPGIPMRILPKIVESSKNARMVVLESMEKTLNAPRTELSAYAPKAVTVKIPEDKIGTVIGSGGKTINELQDKYGVQIAIDDDGTVVVSSKNLEMVKECAEVVKAMVKEVEVGEVYEGVVDGIESFGAFVEILPGKTGLLHVSEIANGFVDNVEDFLKVGDKVKVKVIETQPNGKMSLSKRALEPGYVENERPQRERPSRDRRSRDNGRDRGRDRNHRR